MAKKIVGIVKVRIPGGEATPAPTIGSSFRTEANSNSCIC